MRGSPHPPRATANSASSPAEPPQRKVFNCIVDDTALIAGVKKSTRDGIRKWIAQGAICLFVPLHTLTALHRLKTGNDRVSADAREAVKWLDDITSSSADAADRVVLEGVDEAYTTWEDVARFMLPETLLSMDDSDSDDDDYHEDLESSFNALDMSDGTSMSSAHSLDDAAPKTPDSPRSMMTKSNVAGQEAATDKEHLNAIASDSPARTARNISEPSRGASSPKRPVPAYLKPLFNHVLWRINKESNPDAALASYILLTNDPTKQAIASKFGIRAKRLEQLRDTVAREDREYKNHLTLHRIESESTMAKKNAPPTPKAAERPKSSHSIQDRPGEGSDDEDVVLFQRAPRGPAAITNTHRVWDPNDFGRANQQQSPRGGRGGSIAPRGRGAPSPRGRGAFVPRGAYVPPGPQVRPPPAPRHDPNAPIDPNSFARPMPRASPARGGSGRKLWEPN
ncbi:uncharacterized protein M421DRAFT_51217 [Didymella exigua CBS 183.55]|uniref:PIN domain-containing protein n=1 Tax=Didymella exigua CBS 183.55 TaxID=1150837 RepID=A0A6A5RZC6_9PLEO|nr:uncharacterized protein M421DRAFT_51217 [Didymella exigua CBS 183.55]KAF1933815.1 hypothetical protein M421DRAFT_51217 [Didymella exigua CBS 183.55]